ncbi:MAG: hypothetical protein HQK77_21415 [Desulfobacterales bacterium]|nr:hypothetical protein [Desulfobacterales bacterium]
MNEENEMVLPTVSAGSRYQVLGAGMPSQPVFYFTQASNTPSLLIQSSDTSLHTINLNLNIRSMNIITWMNQ